MYKYSQKFKRALALVLTFVMAVSVMTITPASTAEAASKKVVKSLSGVSANKTVEVGKKFTINAKVNATKKVAKGDLQVSVKSSDKKVATVKVSGKPKKKAKTGTTKITVTGKKAGTATITVTTKATNKKNKKVSKKMKVTVKSAGTTEPTVKTVSKVDVTAAQNTIEIGSSTKVTAVITPQGASSPIKWSSSVPAVATVDANGTVVGLSAGSTVITGTANNGVSGSVTITVKAVSVTGVTLSNDKLSLTEGASSTLTETVLPANATIKRVTWESSDSTVATVDKGVVKAIKEGTATITVTTEDGGFKATAAVQVKADSREDVNGLTARVSNSIDGYENTVFVGTQAKIDIQVTKDGAPYGGDSVAVELQGVSGYTHYYRLSSEDVQTKDDGTATVYLRLAESGSKKPIIESSADRAYASFNVVFTSGGANFTKTIPVSFAQVEAETRYSYYAISVDNEYDPLLKEIETTDSRWATCITQSEDKYDEEYVIDQQVSSDKVDDGDHSVVLDAAPMLIRSARLSEEASDIYNSGPINYTCSEYSVYAGEDTAYTLKNVPGGLEYVTLYFSKLKLSKYSRIIVRAYEAGSNVPLLNNGKLIQQIITADTVIENSSTVQVSEKIFNQATSDKRMIDLKIFAESAGQVSETDNVGFTLTKVEGKWSNQEVLSYDYDRLAEAVEWSFGAAKPRTAEAELPNAQAYMGDFYKAQNTYRYTMPTFPETGNAIITETAGEDKTYYLCPTVAVDNANQLVPAGKAAVFKASSDQIKELTAGQYTKTVGEDNRVTIDSAIAGYIPVKASVKYGSNNQNTNKPVISYDVYSSVQWSPIPGRILYQAKDFYALAGQQVTLTAEVKDKEGNKASNVTVRFEGLDDADGVTLVNSQAKVATNSDGKATLVLKAENIAELSEVSAEVLRNYEVTLQVAGQEVPTGFANIHWVKPGIYYKDAVDGREYTTSDKANAVTADISAYKAGETWIVGTKVVGLSGDEDITIRDISNIKVKFESSSTENITVSQQEKANGVYTLSNNKAGKSTTTVSFDGYIDGNAPCRITVYNEADGEVKEYQSVGTGAFNAGANLVIPIQWQTANETLSLLNYNEKFDIRNGESAHVYAQVLDEYKNKVSDTVVEYIVTDGSGNKVSDGTKVTVNGLADIEITAPDTSETYTISAKISGRTEADAVTERIQFTDNKSEFQMVRVDSDVEAKTIQITFSQKVNVSNLPMLYGNFKVTDNGRTVDIKDISVVEGNVNAVKLTFVDGAAFSSDVQVKVQPSVTEDGVQYMFLSDDGVLYTDLQEAMVTE